MHLSIPCKWEIFLLVYHLLALIDFFLKLQDIEDRRAPIVGSSSRITCLLAISGCVAPPHEVNHKLFLLVLPICSSLEQGPLLSFVPHHASLWQRTWVSPWSTLATCWVWRSIQSDVSRIMNYDSLIPFDLSRVCRQLSRGPKSAANLSKMKQRSLVGATIRWWWSIVPEVQWATTEQRKVEICNNAKRTFCVCNIHFRAHKIGSCVHN